MSIVPAEATGFEALIALPEDKAFMGEFWTPRNPEFHNLFWALCTLVADATDSDKHAVKEWLLKRTGKVDTLQYPDGIIEFRPQSIAWESMGEEEFREFFEAALPVITELLDASSDDVRQQFQSMMNPETRARWRRERRRRRR